MQKRSAILFFIILFLFVWSGCKTTDASYQSQEGLKSAVGLEEQYSNLKKGEDRDLPSADEAVAEFQQEQKEAEEQQQAEALAEEDRLQAEKEEEEARAKAEQDALAEAERVKAEQEATQKALDAQKAQEAARQAQAEKEAQARRQAEQAAARQKAQQQAQQGSSMANGGVTPPSSDRNSNSDKTNNNDRNSPSANNNNGSLSRPQGQNRGQNQQTDRNAPYAPGSSASSDRPGNEADADRSSNVVTIIPDPSYDTIIPPAKKDDKKVLAPLSINAVKGKAFSIILEGEMWFPQTSRIDPALIFQGKDFDQRGRSIFVFRADKVGDYVMSFNRNGLNGLETIQVNIAVTDSVKPPVPAVDDPAVQGSSSSRNQASGEPMAPVQNPGSADQAQKPASGSVEQMIQNNSLKIDSSNQNEILQAASALPEDQVKKLFDAVIRDNSQQPLAGKVLDTFKKRFASSGSTAEMIYNLAQSYEKPGANRNIERAYDLYKQVYDQFPISPYSRLSKQRIDYLNRFYFKIS